MKILMLITLGSALAAFTGCCAPPPVRPGQTTTVWLSPAAATRMAQWIGDRSDRRAGGISSSGSMHPVLDEDDIVIVEHRPYRSLQCDDIVIIAAPWAGSSVAHRLLQRLPTGWWVTCGDANRFPDPLLTEKTYAGSVVIAAIQRHTGAVTVFDRDARPAKPQPIALGEPPPSGQSTPSFPATESPRPRSSDADAELAAVARAPDDSLAPVALECSW